MVNIKCIVRSSSSQTEKYRRDAYYWQLDKIRQQNHQTNMKSTSAIFKNHCQLFLKIPSLFTDKTYKATDKNNKDKPMFLISCAPRVPGTDY